MSLVLMLMAVLGIVAVFALEASMPWGRLPRRFLDDLVVIIVLVVVLALFMFLIYGG